MRSGCLASAVSGSVRIRCMSGTSSVIAKNIMANGAPPSLTK